MGMSIDGVAHYCEAVINQLIISLINPIINLVIYPHFFRFASSISKGIPETDKEMSEQLGRAIVGPYIKHLSSFGDKVKSSLLRDVHTLPMVRLSSLYQYKAASFNRGCNLKGLFR